MCVSFIEHNIMQLWHVNQQFRHVELQYLSRMVKHRHTLTQTAMLKCTGRDKCAISLPRLWHFFETGSLLLFIISFYLQIIGDSHRPRCGINSLEQSNKLIGSLKGNKSKCFSGKANVTWMDCLGNKEFQWNARSTFLQYGYADKDRY